jgi:hypothetical protein
MRETTAIAQTCVAKIVYFDVAERPRIVNGYCKIQLAYKCTQDWQDHRPASVTRTDSDVSKRFFFLKAVTFTPVAHHVTVCHTEID